MHLLTWNGLFGRSPPIGGLRADGFGGAFVLLNLSNLSVRKGRFCLLLLILMSGDFLRPQTTTPTTAAPAATPTATTSCPAAFGVYSSTAGGAASASAAAASSTPTVSVQQTNSGGGSTSTGGATPSSGSGNPHNQLLRSDIITLAADAQISAFDVVTALSGKITGVTLVAVGPRSILFSIDPTKIGWSKPQSLLRQSVSVTATAVTKDNPKGVSATATLPIVVRPSDADLHSGTGGRLNPKPTPGKFTINTLALPDAVSGSAYQATVQTAGAPSGATLTWALGNNAPKWLSFSSAASGQLTGTVPDLPDDVSTRRIKDQLTDLIRGLPAVSNTLEVIRLPDGYGHACDIITAIGRQIPSVISLSVIDDSRVLAGVSGNPEQVADTARKLRELTGQLAVSSVSPQPKVTSVLAQLYYDRDAASVATAITQSFSQLKVSPVSSNSSVSSYADSLILADPTGTENSSALEQARRMIAQIDQPRPQMTVNAWSLQVSSENQKKILQLVPEARRLAAGYNDALGRSIGLAWDYLNGQVAVGVGSDGKQYLNPEFAAYICAIAEYPNAANGSFQLDPEGVCPKNSGLSYSLGYTNIFDRESPNLVQLMLLLMAANDPSDEAKETLDRMEHLDVCPPTDQQSDKADQPHCEWPYARSASCQEADAQLYDRQLQPRGGQSPDAAEDDDNSNPIFDTWHRRQPPMYAAFECTRNRHRELLKHPPNTGGKPVQTYIGLFRAAVADFLFQNKMKAEYPNDFQPYLYPASAAKLDAALTPIIEPFNEDMQALQQYLQNQLTVGIPRDKHLAYTSNGLITVSVISGNQASVLTQSLNYFPQNPTMKLENFAAQLGGGGGSSGSGGSTSQNGGGTPPVAPLLGGTLSGVVRSVAAFDAAEPSQVTAKVGSGLSMTVTPYALSSDSGAELYVNVTYNENAAGMISANTAQASSTDDLNSRVSEHEVSTLVRMDALKFFEISTMQSVIARQKAPYKLFDPVIELPLFDGLGVFPNWRRKPDVIYNQSVIFLQAAIVPTAADLGNSIQMQYDRILSQCPKDKPCSSGYRVARAASDYDENKINCNCDPAKRDDSEIRASHLNELKRIMEYHRLMMRYFSGMTSDEQCTATSGVDEQCPQWDKVPPFIEDVPSEFGTPVSDANELFDKSGRNGGVSATH
jgi:hypothetical protein